jgi:hypothetical protein
MWGAGLVPTPMHKCSDGVHLRLMDGTGSSEVYLPAQILPRTFQVCAMTSCHPVIASEAWQSRWLHQIASADFVSPRNDFCVTISANHHGIVSLFSTAHKLEMLPNTSDPLCNAEK